MTHWEEKYQANTIPWDRGAASPALQAWFAGDTRAQGHILVPGCGRGHEVLELARRGFQVTALDIAPSALQWLEGELAAVGLEAERVCADVFTWQPDQPFDAIYEQTCLCAIEPALWPAYERQLHGWLRPGGHLYVLFMQTGKEDGPPFHCDWQAMRTLFDAAYWAWPGIDATRIDHPIGLHELATVLTRR